MIIYENNTKYHIYTCKTKQQCTELEQFIVHYTELKKRRIIGVDFEFNRQRNQREIALCQINFEVIGEKEHSIFLFYPPDISLIILKKLFTNTKIKKILHGSESLDIPYLYNSILTTDSESLLFSHNLFNTRYIFEYYTFFS